DKGYCQLLSPGLRIRDYFQKRWLDAPFIEKEFGVLPRQLPDYFTDPGVLAAAGVTDIASGTDGLTFPSPGFLPGVSHSGAIIAL
ncbi:hypothetical protein ONO12_27500, partial [Salmonella enterica subsp. enterica serovar Montevideo]|nr:hypothetical protein [Salmonella enterica subsp. enterica serovar Montevideo]